MLYPRHYLRSLPFGSALSSPLSSEVRIYILFNSRVTLSLPSGSELGLPYILFNSRVTLSLPSGRLQPQAGPARGGVGFLSQAEDSSTQPGGSGGVSPPARKKWCFGTQYIAFCLYDLTIHWSDHNIGMITTAGVQGAAPLGKISWKSQTQ